MIYQPYPPFLSYFELFSVEVGRAVLLLLLFQIGCFDPLVEVWVVRVETKRNVLPRVRWVNCLVHTCPCELELLAFPSLHPSQTIFLEHTEESFERLFMLSIMVSSLRVLTIWSEKRLQAFQVCKQTFPLFLKPKITFMPLRNMTYFFNEAKHSPSVKSSQTLTL